MVRPPDHEMMVTENVVRYSQISKERGISPMRATWGEASGSRGRQRKWEEM